jgi:hypothetical protein
MASRFMLEASVVSAFGAAAHARGFNAVKHKPADGMHRLVSCIVSKSELWTCKLFAVEGFALEAVYA